MFLDCCRETVSSVLARNGCDPPVGGCGEDSEDDIPAVHADDGTGGMQEVEVEVRVSRDRAVQPSFQERRPLLFEDALRTALIGFANSRDTRHNHLKSQKMKLTYIMIMNFKHLIIHTSNSTVYPFQKASNLLILVDFKQILESS